MSSSPALEPVPMPIETDRLTLRPYVREDAEQLGAVVRSAYDHLRPWMPWATPDQTTERSLETIARMQSRWALREDLALGIFDRTTGEVIGGTGLHRMDWSARMFEIGYWIHPEREGRGYVTESTRALTDYAFDVLRAERVEIRLDPRNTRSRAVPQRLDFVLEGTCAPTSAMSTAPFATPRSTRSSAPIGAPAAIADPSKARAEHDAHGRCTSISQGVVDGPHARRARRRRVG